MPKVSTDRAVADAQADDIRLEDIKVLEAFLQQHPDLADEPRMRWLIFNRKSNGIEAAGAVVKRAGRWYVVVPRLAKWLLKGAGRPG